MGVWKHVTHRDVRARALQAIRWVREEMPSLTMEMATAWEMRRRDFLGLDSSSPKGSRRWSDTNLARKEGNSIQKFKSKDDSYLDEQPGVRRSQSDLPSHTL